MKNIHVIATDKPSRLYLSNYGKELNLSAYPLRNYTTGQHIYITSNEEIKRGDCILLPNSEIIILPTGLSQVPLSNFIRGYSLSDCKKIILTTDQDLIKDGVQAIDDEFLEWFVKNPSCESVKVVPYLKSIINPITNEEYPTVQYRHFDLSKMICEYKYKIIIPKEEQKQHLINMMKSDEELGLYKEPKQETLEEAAERLTQDYNSNISNKLIAKTFITVGAKWQQEQDKNLYSEEEVLELLKEVRKGSMITSSINNRTYWEFDIKSEKKWFEQFKKK
jgi:hypothetical protein